MPADSRCRCRPIRPDGVEKVTGRARFGADLVLPNMIHGKILRSPHAHARIKRVDVSAALAMPGVKAAVCGELCHIGDSMRHEVSACHTLSGCEDPHLERTQFRTATQVSAATVLQRVDTCLMDAQTAPA